MESCGEPRDSPGISAAGENSAVVGLKVKDTSADPAVLPLRLVLIVKGTSKTSFLKYLQ